MTNGKPIVPLIKHGVSRAAMRQKTFDVMDQTAEQASALKLHESGTPLIKFDESALAKFDESVVLDLILKDPGCDLVRRAQQKLTARYVSKEEVAENILQLIKRGEMTCGIHEGQFRIGITSAGWKNVSKKLRR